jgi:hypothetical protein
MPAERIGWSRSFRITLVVLELCPLTEARVFKAFLLVRLATCQSEQGQLTSFLMRASPA